jgi:hypothetical protein
LRIDYFDTLEQEILDEHIISDSFEHNPLLDDWSDSDEEDDVCENQEFEPLASANAMTTEDAGCIKDNSGRIGECDQPASDDAPKVELKPLPFNLRYAFLGPNDTYPVIINANLNESETQSLLAELRVHKKAIGYTIDDIKGISPSVCIHRILMEDDHKPSIESQRRLNPNLKDMVKK